jgi:hypothetical protein
MDEDGHVEFFDEVPERLGNRVKVLAVVARGNGRSPQAKLADRPGRLRGVLWTMPRGCAGQGGNAVRVRCGERRDVVVVLVGVADVGDIAIAVPDVRIGNDREIELALLLTTKTASTSNISTGRCPLLAHPGGNRWL